MSSNLARSAACGIPAGLIPGRFYAGPAGSNPVEMVAAIGTAFEDFRGKQDLRLHAIEAALDNQSKSLARLTLGGLQGGEIADQSLSSVDAFNAAARVLRPNAAVQVGASELTAYRNALGQYLRVGPAALAPSVLNEMSVGSDPSGGFLVVPDRGGRFVGRLYDTSPVRSVANVQILLASDTMEGVYDADDLTSGGWVSEQEPRTDTATAEVGIYRIPVHEQYVQPVLTQKLLDDAPDVVALVEGKIISKFARIENTAFVLGDGVGKPRGFLSYGNSAVAMKDSARTWGKLQYIPTGKSGSFADTNPADVLFDTVAALKAIYRAGSVWMMNRATAAIISKFKDGQGNYLWSQGSVAQGIPSTLLGYPVIEAEDMPDGSAGNFPIAFGDFRSGYTIVDRIGVSILRDPYTAKGKVKFYARKRVGADVVDFDAIKLVKFAAS